MSSCTQIIARGLSVETIGRLGGKTEAVLDLPPGFSHRFSKDVERLSTIGKITAEGVLNFNLPFSFTNDAVFIDFESPLALDQTRDFIFVSVLIDGHEIPFDRLGVIGPNAKDKEWECQLLRRSDHWIELIQDKQLNTINFGNPFYLTKPNVLTSWESPQYNGGIDPWDDQTGTGFNGIAHIAPLDFGNWVDQTEQPQLQTAGWKPIVVEDFRPLLSLAYILKRGFCEIGWTLQGIIFDTVWFRRLWIYILKQDFYIGEGKGYRYGRAGRVTLRHLGARYQLQPGFPTLVATLNEFNMNTALPYLSSLSGKWRLGLQSPLPFLSKYKFRAKFKVTNENPGVAPMVFAVGEISKTNTANSIPTGEFFSEDFAVEIQPGETKEVILELDALVGYQQKAALFWTNADFDGVFIEPGLWFECEPDNQSFTRNDFIELAAMIDPQWKLIDAMKAALHLFRGLIETDFETKTVTVHVNRTANVHGENVPPFLKVEAPPINIDDRIICESIRQLPQKLTLKRYTRLEFADSADAYIQSLKSPEKLYSRTILNGIELPNETTRLTNPMFEPTADGQSPYLAIYGRDHTPKLPRLWDNTDGQRSFAIGPRIFFAFGKVKQRYPYPLTPNDQYCGFFFDGLIKPTGVSSGDYVREFGYVSQLRDWAVEPTPAVDGSVVFAQREFDLFVMFYLGITAENRRGVILDALLKMTADEYNRIDFRDIYTFTYLGRQMNVPMISVRDAAPCKGGPSPVQFFAAPVDSTCCDLPCGCQFTTCEFYQDLGMFITQSTMNKLSITSFKVDDVEFIVDPIELGAIKMIDLAGRPYITNLVDKLNSLGVPYFYFYYSTRVHPEKGLRYFKMKRPTCQSFEIIISELANEVYKYTQSEQATQWFGSWAPFGYGSTFHSTPIDCLTTTEY